MEVPSLNSSIQLHSTNYPEGERSVDMNLVWPLLAMTLISSLNHEVGHYIAARILRFEVECFLGLPIGKLRRAKLWGKEILYTRWLAGVGVKIRSSTQVAVWRLILFHLYGTTVQFLLIMAVAGVFFRPIGSEVISELIRSSANLQRLILLLMKIELFPQTVIAYTQQYADLLIDHLGFTELATISSLLDRSGFWTRALLGGLVWNTIIALWNLFPFPGSDGWRVVKTVVRAFRGRWVRKE
jgi:Zn-dependent protease